ncbi:MULTISPECIES: outer membrane beta-barrel protein [Halomonadaceae]|uniref:Outer membrane protein with beta-barrel domain n=1 Tax=Onishia taeanensis TaxID=284577 RepID=A0A328XI28_9GAMM|nr:MULTISPECIES: outer membrane beta-barrel protein [Halomonas]RAR59076.1 outer membrane protein with beta-barrel domain [Halomonas taeanensis]
MTPPALSRCLIHLTLLCLLGISSTALAARSDNSSIYADTDDGGIALDNGLTIGGSKVNTANGDTTGFRVMAGYFFSRLPHLEFGAELAYLESNNVSVSLDGSPTLLDTISMNGSLLAGVKMGRVGVFAKSGLAEWRGSIDSPESSGSMGGTAPIYGMGANMRLYRSLVGQLEYEVIDSNDLDHLTMATASLIFRF